MFSRYFPLGVHTCARSFEFAVKFSSLRDGPMARAWYASQVLVASLVVSALEVLLMARVYAMLNQPRWMKNFFIALLFAENAISVVGLCLTLPDDGFEPFLITTHLPRSFAYFGLSALAVQCILLGFTIRGYRRLPWKTLPLVRLMLRDGTLAFAAFAVFTSVLVSYTLRDIAYAVTGYAWLLTAISCVTCRLIINMLRAPRTTDPTAWRARTSTHIQFTSVVTDGIIDEMLSCNFINDSRISSRIPLETTGSYLPTVRTPSPLDLNPSHNDSS